MFGHISNKTKPESGTKPTCYTYPALVTFAYANRKIYCLLLGGDTTSPRGEKEDFLYTGQNPRDYRKSFVMVYISLH